MTHIIYIYFIVNAFLAGQCWGDDKDLRLTVLALFFGSLSPVIFALHWIDRKIEFRTILALVFTDHFKKDINIEYMRGIYKYSNRYKKWVIRMIDKKYNYGITKVK